MKGHIQRRGKDTWPIIYDLPPGRDGKRRQRSVTVHGPKRDAQVKLREIPTSLDTGDHVEPTKETLSSYLERWLDSYAATATSLRTQRDYRGIIHGYLIPILGGIPLRSLRPDHVQALHRELFIRGLAPRTVLHAHRVLGDALNRAVRWRLLTQNVCSMVDPPRTEQKEMQVLDREGVAAFLRGAQESRYGDLFYVILLTGMRRSEALALRWPQVDLEEGYISVVAGLHRIKGKGLVLLRTKTEKSRRRIAIPRNVIDVLRKIRTSQMEQRLAAGPVWQQTKFVLTTGDGSSLDPERVSNAFTAIRKSAGLPPVPLHDLRHTHATIMIKQGEHVKMVSERLGHANVQTTLELYTHVLPGMQEEAAERFSSWVGESS